MEVTALHHCPTEGSFRLAFSIKADLNVRFHSSFNAIRYVQMLLISLLQTDLTKIRRRASVHSSFSIIIICILSTYIICIVLTLTKFSYKDPRAESKRLIPVNAFLSTYLKACSDYSVSAATCNQCSALQHLALVAGHSRIAVVWGGFARLV